MGTSSGPGREDNVGDENRQKEEVSARETALRGLLGINGGNDEDDARVQIESDLLKYCLNENPYLSPRLVLSWKHIGYIENRSLAMPSEPEFICRSEWNEEKDTYEEEVLSRSFKRK